MLFNTTFLIYFANYVQIFANCNDELQLLTIMISNFVIGWGADPHMPVVIACAVAGIVGKVCGYEYKDMLAGALDAVSRSLEAIIIILFVGCLIGSFEWAGTIPAVVF